jgi:hypothetical protein
MIPGAKFQTQCLEVMSKMSRGSAGTDNEKTLILNHGTCPYCDQVLETAFKMTGSFVVAPKVHFQCNVGRLVRRTCVRLRVFLGRASAAAILKAVSLRLNLVLFKVKSMA